MALAVGGALSGEGASVGFGLAAGQGEAQAGALGVHQVRSLELDEGLKDAVVFGEKGFLAADYGRWVLSPADKFKGFQPPKPWIPASVGHHREWLNACKTGSPTLCNFGYGGLLVENLLLSIVACRVQKKLQWDPVNLRATNCPEADRFIRKQYRQGWTI